MKRTSYLQQIASQTSVKRSDAVSLLTPRPVLFRPPSSAEAHFIETEMQTGTQSTQIDKTVRPGGRAVSQSLASGAPGNTAGSIAVGSQAVVPTAASLPAARPQPDAIVAELPQPQFDEDYLAPMLRALFAPSTPQNILAESQPERPLKPALTVDPQLTQPQTAPLANNSVAETSSLARASSGLNTQANELKVQPQTMTLAPAALHNTVAAKTDFQLSGADLKPNLPDSTGVAGYRLPAATVPAETEMPPPQTPGRPAFSALAPSAGGFGLNSAVRQPALELDTESAAAEYSRHGEPRAVIAPSETQLAPAPAAIAKPDFSGQGSKPAEQSIKPVETAAQPQLLNPKDLSGALQAALSELKPLQSGIPLLTPPPLPERSPSASHAGDNVQPTLHIGTLEVRVTPATPPPVSMPAPPRTLSRAANRSSNGSGSRLARGFGIFGFGQS